MNTLVKIGDAARRLGVSPITLRRLDREGAIPAARRHPRTAAQSERDALMFSANTVETVSPDDGRKLPYRVAVHEAGHAIAFYLQHRKIEFTTILPKDIPPEAQAKYNRPLAGVVVGRPRSTRRMTWRAAGQRFHKEAVIDLAGYAVEERLQWNQRCDIFSTPDFENAYERALAEYTEREEDDNYLRSKYGDKMEQYPDLFPALEPVEDHVTRFMTRAWIDAKAIFKKSVYYIATLTLAAGLMNQGTIQGPETRIIIRDAIRKARWLRQEGPYSYQEQIERAER